MRFAFALLLATVPAAAQSVAVHTSASPGSSLTAHTGNPVTMTFERTQKQTLADGTHITNMTHEWFYRDSDGRTRQDHELPFLVRTGLPMSSVMVHDPIAGFTLTWQTGGDSAGPRHFTSLDTDAARAQALQERADAAAANPPLPSLRRDPATAQGSSDDHPKPKHTLERLGTQEVQGVPCEATRATTVYPPGSLGNDRAITTTTERCLSREFGRALREVDNDPRTGTRTLTLQSITRGEPDPAVFHPPADYLERSQTP